MTEEKDRLLDLESIAAMRRYYDWKAGMVARHLGDRVVEVGCGNGLVLERLPRRGMLLGVDMDELSVRAAHERLAVRPDVEVLRQDVLDPGFLAFADRRPDTVLFVNSLETTADDALALRQARAVLPGGGRLVLYTSALPILAGEIDRLLGQHRYSRSGLRALLGRAGFTVGSMRYVNLLGILGWWLDNRRQSGRTHSAREYRARDRFVPLVRLVDALTGPPVGQSMLVVATAA